jgi:putative aldouronate transport system substrate-binding protein
MEDSMTRSSFGKWVFITLCLFLTGAMVYATGSSQQPAAGAGGKQTLQVAIPQPANVSDYRNNYLTSYLEKLHNIAIDFYILPSDAAESRTKISLMAASNDLPETIWAGGMTREQIFDFGSKGALVALNRYYNDPSKTPYFNRIPDVDRKQILMDVTNPDGNIYSFARYTPMSWNQTPYRFYINRSWLTKLGLREPKTTDELRNVLIAFRDRDPNGNGRRDEIGVFGFYNGGYGEDVITALINCFVYYFPGVVSTTHPSSTAGNIALDSTGNNVIAPFTDPGFRKAMQYLNGLFREGLLDASTFTVDQPSFRATLNANPTVVGFTSAGSVGNFPDYENNPNFISRAPIYPPLTGPDGISYTPYNAYNAEQMTFITNKAKNVDLAVKVMDSFYEDDLSIITRFGEENVDWTKDPAILRTLTSIYVDMGLFPSVTLATLKDDLWIIPTNRHWANQTPRYYPFEKSETGGSAVTPYNPNSFSVLNGAINFAQYLPRHPQYILPLLHYTANDATTLTQPIVNITTYVRQSIAEFTIGTRDINNDAAWNAYLRELDTMGLQQWLRIAQTTYNRQR